ncbi:MAG: hypothetical protein ACYTES_05310 [Planctomycetota bacterium]|jgi:hypothetical protein
MPDLDPSLVQIGHGDGPASQRLRVTHEHASPTGAQPSRLVHRRHVCQRRGRRFRQVGNQLVEEACVLGWSNEHDAVTACQDQLLPGQLEQAQIVLRPQDHRRQAPQQVRALPGIDLGQHGPFRVVVVAPQQHRHRLAQAEVEQLARLGVGGVGKPLPRFGKLPALQPRLDPVHDRPVGERGSHPRRPLHVHIHADIRRRQGGSVKRVGLLAARPRQRGYGNRRKGDHLRWLYPPRRDWRLLLGILVGRLIVIRRRR